MRGWPERHTLLFAEVCRVWEWVDDFEWVGSEGKVLLLKIQSLSKKIKGPVQETIYYRYGAANSIVIYKSRSATSMVHWLLWRRNPK